MAIVNQNFEKQLEKFREEVDGDIYGGLLIYMPNEKKFAKISYGDGSNLLDEDITEGCDDYIYIEIDEFNGSWNEDIDGAQLMLKMQEEWGGHYNICQHAVDALELLAVGCGIYDEDAIILQSFQH